MNVLARWFFVFWLSLLLLRLVFWLWAWHPLALVVIVFCFLIAALPWRQEQRRRRRVDYWVEELSPGSLRAEPDDWAVVYHEGPNALWFRGKIRPYGPNVLWIPSARRWQERMPEWALGRREEIRLRVSEGLDPTRYVWQEE
jgi:hypothetical protein